MSDGPRCDILSIVIVMLLPRGWGDMGSVDAPLYGTGRLVRFANELRWLRRMAGKTYRQMETPAVGRTKLCNAAGGVTLPTAEVLQVFVVACGGDTTYWLKELEKLIETREKGRKLRRASPPALHDFLQAFAALRRSQGVTLALIHASYGSSIRRISMVIRLDALRLPPHDLVMHVVEMCGGDRVHWDAQWHQVAALCAVAKPVPKLVKQSA